MSESPDAPPPADAPAPEVRETPATPAEAPRRDADPGDPNANVVYDVLHDIADLDQVARLKWDIFSVEQRLERVLREDADLASRGGALRDELSGTLETYRANEDVAAYKERFVQNEERLKLVELVRFLELAVIVREPLHEAWARYLAWDHERLLAELSEVDREGLAKRPATLLQGVRETMPRRCNAVIAYTERNARQVFREMPYRDWSRVIAWHEEKNPALANLIADARMLYLQAGVAREQGRLAAQMKWLAIAIAGFTAIAALAAIASFLRR